MAITIPPGDLGATRTTTSVGEGVAEGMFFDGIDVGQDVDDGRRVGVPVGRVGVAV